MRNIKADYERITEIKNAYENAKEAKNQAGMEKSREEMHSLNGQIASERREYGRILRFYEESRDRENELLDISENIWNREVEGLIQTMRENGIKEFTFSSTWSSTVETAWLFTKQGCSLKGMVEINGNREYMSEESAFEKKHAYLFGID